MTLTLTGLVVVALASWRTWNLLARDAITAPLRRLAAKLKIATFLECPACAGFWITAALATAWLTLDHWSLTLVVAILATHGAWLAAMVISSWAAQAIDDVVINQTQIAKAQKDAAAANVEMSAEARRTTALYTGREIT